MQAKGEGYVYVAGRIRARGEMNGKSGNLNNVLAQLYGDLPIPGNEILCILDADMVHILPACALLFSIMSCGRCFLLMYHPDSHNNDRACFIYIG